MTESDSPDGPALITQTELREDAMPLTGAGAKSRHMTGPIPLIAQDFLVLGETTGGFPSPPK
jgi:hypothetical protein